MEDAVNVEVDNSQISATPTADANVATNVEVDNSQLSTTNVDNSVNNSQVINNATPMDTNTTYNNLNEEERTPAVGVNASPLQGAIEEAIHNQRNTMLENNAGQFMDEFLNNDYDYDINEAGTYWVAGAINDNNTQMKFLNTLIKEQMYDELDLQKYYYDTTLATARAYKAAKNNETAYKLYLAAQEKAIAEGNMIGWYMPPEGEYMLGQYVVAHTKLGDPDLSDDERLKANNVIKTTEKWFAANKIGTRGIKCLGQLQYEENKRHNDIMGQLLHEANQIAAGQAGTNAELQKLQLRQFKFQVEEMELQFGAELTKPLGLDDEVYFGHDTSQEEYKAYPNLRGAEDIKTLLKNTDTFGDLLTAKGIQWLRDNLGDDYEKYHQEYLSAKLTQYMSEMKEDTDLAENKGLMNFVGKVQNQELGNNTKIYTSDALYNTIVNKKDGTKEIRWYIIKSDGTMFQLKESDNVNNIKLQNGFTVGEKFNYDNYETKYDNIVNDEGYKIYVNSSSVDENDVLGKIIYNRQMNHMPKGANDALTELQKKGYVVVPGYYARNTGVYKNVANELILERNGVYYRMNTSAAIETLYSSTSRNVSGIGGGDIVEINKDDLVRVPNNLNDLSQGEREAVWRQQIVTYSTHGSEEMAKKYGHPTGVYMNGKEVGFGFGPDDTVDYGIWYDEDHKAHYIVTSYHPNMLSGAKSYTDSTPDVHEISEQEYYSVVPRGSDVVEIETREYAKVSDTDKSSETFSDTSKTKDTKTVTTNSKSVAPDVPNVKDSDRMPTEKEFRNEMERQGITMDKWPEFRNLTLQQLQNRATINDVLGKENK